MAISWTTGDELDYVRRLGNSAPNDLALSIAALERYLAAAAHRANWHEVDGVYVLATVESLLKRLKERQAEESGDH